MSKPQSNKKSRTIELGKVKSVGEGKAFNFSQEIKEITLTIERQVEGETILEKVKIEPKEVNGKKYLGAFINSIDEHFNFKVEKGWMDADKAEQAVDKLKEYNFSSIFTVKVTN